MSSNKSHLYKTINICSLERSILPHFRASIKFHLTNEWRSMSRWSVIRFTSTVTEYLKYFITSLWLTVNTWWSLIIKLSHVNINLINTCWSTDHLSMTPSTRHQWHWRVSHVRTLEAPPLFIWWVNNQLLSISRRCSDQTINKSHRLKLSFLLIFKIFS